MESALPVAGLAVLAFAATNLDNLLLLVGIVSRAGQSFARVVAGTLLAAVVMLALCMGAALAVDFAPQRWVGYLGFVPVALGLRDPPPVARGPCTSQGAPPHWMGPAAGWPPAPSTSAEARAARQRPPAQQTARTRRSESSA